MLPDFLKQVISWNVSKELFQMAGFADRDATVFNSNKINCMGQQEPNVKSKWRAERL